MNSDTTALSNHENLNCVLTKYFLTSVCVLCSCYCIFLHILWKQQLDKSDCSGKTAPSRWQNLDMMRVISELWMQLGGDCFNFSGFGFGCNCPGYGCTSGCISFFLVTSVVCWVGLVASNGGDWDSGLFRGNLVGLYLVWFCSGSWSDKRLWHWWGFWTSGSKSRVLK